jgi:hypothetical protein
MGDEVAGDALAVDAHAVVADDQVESLPCYYFVEAPFLQIYGTHHGGQARSKSRQKESGAAIGSRIILEEQEIALWAFLLQERQGIAATTHSNLMPPGEEFLDEGDIPGGMAQPPAEGAYKNMSHFIKEIYSDSINRFSWALVLMKL